MPDRVYIESARRAYYDALESESLGRRFLIFDELDSTSAYIRRIASDEEARGLAAAALRQSEGRGRLGRSWESGGNGLYLSFAVFTAAENLTRLPLAAAAAATDALEKLGVSGTGIKWPNDIILSGKKIAGILCQAWGSRACVGIGVNIAQDAETFARTGLEHASSLALLGFDIDMWTLAAGIISAADRRISQLESGRYDELLSDYRRRCISIGREVMAMKADRMLSGRAVDVDSDGRLVIETPCGKISVDSGEVKLRTKDGYV